MTPSFIKRINHSRRCRTKYVRNNFEILEKFHFSISKLFHFNFTSRSWSPVIFISLCTSREKWKNFFFTLHFLIVQNPLDRRTLISLPLFFRKVLLHWFSLYIDIKFRSFRLKEERYLFVPHIFAPNQELESVFFLLPLWKWGKTSASQQHQKILRKVSKFEPLFVFSSFTFMMLFMMKTMMMLVRD